MSLSETGRNVRSRSQRQVKYANKVRLAAKIKELCGVTVNPKALFDIQARIWDPGNPERETRRRSVLRARPALRRCCCGAVPAALLRRGRGLSFSRVTGSQQQRREQFLCRFPDGKHNSLSLSHLR